MELSLAVQNFLGLLDNMFKIKLPEEVTLEIAGLVRSKKIEKYDRVLVAGQVCEYVYFIVKGVLRCYYVKGETLLSVDNKKAKESSQGKPKGKAKKKSEEKEDDQVTTWLFMENNVVVSIDSFYVQDRGLEYIQAMETTEVIYISHKQMRGLGAKYPEFKDIIEKLIAVYLMLWNHRLKFLLGNNAKERVSLFMNSGEADLHNRVKHEYIASYLGMAPETFSREKRPEK